MSQPYLPTWESLNCHNPGGTAPEWFMDAKFGIYFHWGPYSVPAFGNEWYAKWMYEKGMPHYEHHLENYGDPYTEWGYDKFITGAFDKKGNWKQFAPKLKKDGGNFDPEEWAEIFRKSGAGFAGPAAEHCDGWSNWPSSCNQWNAGSMGPKMDLVGLLTDAIRREGLRVIITMHHQYSVNGDYFSDVPPQEEPALRTLYYQNSRDDKMAIYLQKLKEVIDGYRPDVLWQDSGLWNIDENVRLEFLSYYYNRAAEWEKEVIATSKGGLTIDSSVFDYERGGPRRMLPYYYVTDDSISPDTWCYTEPMRLYGSRELVHALLDHISKNGNFLLNVCPKADGTFPEEQKRVLFRLGEWISRNEEAVYGTRAWDIFGEGPTVMGSDHFSDMITGTGEDIRYTVSKDRKILYASVLGFPEKGEVRLSAFGENKNRPCPKNISLLGEKKGERIPLGSSMRKDGLHILFPDSLPDFEEAYVIRLELS